VSLDAIKAAFAVKTPSAISKAVLVAMADCAKPDGSNIYPSRQTLVNKTQLAERTITKAKAELLDGGFIVITNYGNGTTNTYAMPLKSSVYVLDSNESTWYQGRTRCQRSTRGTRGKKKQAPDTTPEAPDTREGGHEIPPNSNGNSKLTGEVQNFNSESENIYRDIEQQRKPTSRPVLRCDVSETSEWTWPLEIFDDSQPFSELDCYLGWTERQLRAECKEVPMPFDMYCWRIESGFYSPGKSESYAPLKGDIGGDE